MNEYYKTLDSILILKQITIDEFNLKLKKQIIKNFSKWYGLTKEETKDILDMWLSKNQGRRNAT
tara:strand:+ start:412 stop:603 length:192 start_codon:yes stop_codon:yes gene_type:complete